MAEQKSRQSATDKRRKSKREKPVVLITGAAGAVGSGLVKALKREFTLVGMDLPGQEADCECFGVDLTSEDSVRSTLSEIADKHGSHLASVVHLAAYFDFTGKPHPLYEKLNVEGTRNLLRALQDYRVDQFVYSGTMLVHEAGRPGDRIDENTPIAPKWAYPQSKAKAEQAIRDTHGDIPYVLLHLAGLYDEAHAIPTLSQQIARIYERRPTSHFYAADGAVGQSVIHKDDMVDAFKRTIKRRDSLPKDTTILVGEPDPMGYDELQDEIGRLIHGSDGWATVQVPKPLAKAGAWAKVQAEPVVPDELDRGVKPFIRPFLIDMADDHYALDISRARELLDWRPKHDLRQGLGQLIKALKDDPKGWYKANGITPPDWLDVADPKTDDAEALRQNYEDQTRIHHRRSIWSHFLNVGMGAWLITAPATLGYQSDWLTASDILSGLLVTLFAVASLSWSQPWARWATAGVGLWLLFAPLVFWAPTPASYLNDTLVGAIVIGLAVLLPPAPGVSPAAEMTGPTQPPGWTFNPSAWLQRAPIIVLAFVGLYISRYLTAYQLGHIDAVWEPFFAGTEPGLNGTEDIITSRVSEAWPVPDAGLGAVTYLLEILVGLAGGVQRWRTMPWLVTVFGFMIVPLGAVSITFIVIQPIVIGTWCTLCLIQALAMLIQIPYSLDELVATGQFLVRRKRRGRPILRVFFFGDTDDERDDEATYGPPRDEFDRPVTTVFKDMLTGGVSITWQLAGCIVIGVWLMFTRLTLGAEDLMADSDHLIGSLVVTITVVALAESARPLRLLNLPFGLALIVIPFFAADGLVQILAGILAGIALIVLSLPRGAIHNRYGSWNRFLV